MKNILILILFLLISASHKTTGQTDFKPNKILPSAKQVEYQQMEFIGFIHFNMNTFSDKEWGFGNEEPTLFNPNKLDVGQWVRVAKEAGMKELILTAKHHDGFCLWPSVYTEHSIKNSPYKNGKGDIVKEFTDACRKYNIKPGIYLSPWDRNHGKYGEAEYIDYYKNQLRELLTNYGNIYEVWFDGANGGEGYYGGANEIRKIDSKTYYPWKELAEIIYQLQPQALIFSDAGPDLRWIGNERGLAGETFWSTINSSQLIIGASDENYLNTGDSRGNAWLVGICDVSIRPGWFYHASEDRLVKLPRELTNIYYNSVGRNAVMLLNIPPDRNGRIKENDINSLNRFRQIINQTFKNNLAAAGKISASDFFLNSEKFKPQNALDNDDKTYWAAAENKKGAFLEVELGKIIKFDRIVLQEPIPLGQRISSFEVQVFGNNKWETITTGTTVGYKRILRIPS
ncbi:MAG: alpha-L-fucosidase, partial [Methanococcaceae archaeon]